MGGETYSKYHRDYHVSPENVTRFAISKDNILTKKKLQNHGREPKLKVKWSIKYIGFIRSKDKFNTT